MPFLRAQGHNPDVLIVPPVEIQAVWLSHMLNSLAYVAPPKQCVPHTHLAPTRYKTFAEALVPGLERVPHPVTRCLTPQQRLVGEERCTCGVHYACLDLPNRFRALCSGDAKGELSHANLHALLPGTLKPPRAQDIVDDRMWVREVR